MPQFARQETKCQAAPRSTSELWLDVEVLAECHEALAALSPLEDDPPKDEPQEETDDTDEKASDDLPF